MAITFNHNDQVYVKDGKMGIGASDPLRDLHVVGNFAVNAGTDEYYGVYIPGNAEGSDPQILIGDWHNASATITWDSSARALNIDTQYSTGAGTFNITGNDGASTFLTVNTSGNVGIGTTDPDYKLHVDTATGTLASWDNGDGAIWSTTSNTKSIGLSSGTNYGQGSNFTWMKLTGGSSGSMIFAVNNERMRITSAGNVGIGTTSPSSTLTVNGAIEILKDDVSSTSEGGHLTLRAASDASYIYRYNIDNYSDKLRFFREDDTTGSNGVVFMQFESDGDLRLNQYGAGVLTTDASGNITASTAYQTQSTADGRYVNVTGDTMTGQLVIQKTGNFTAAKFKGTAADGYGQINVENDLGTALILGSMGSTKTGTFFDNARYIGATSGELVLKTYSSTDGHMKFLSGGQNERMRITASGNVGIGTTSPGARVHIKGTATGHELLRLEGGVADANPYISFYQTSTRRSFIQHNDANNNLIIASEYGLISFKTASDGSETERMRITSGGNVGIGVTNPTEKLHVVGNIISRSSGDTSYIAHSGSTDVYLAIAGRVSDYPNPSDNAGSIILTKGTTGEAYPFNAYGHMVISARHNAATDILFRTNGALRAVIDGSGNVGIGTTDPTARLNVSGVSTGAAIDWSNTTATTGRSFRWVSLNAGGFAVEDLTASGANRLLIDSSGNVGIGETSPTFKLEVKDPTSGIATIQVRNDEGTDGSGAGIRLYTSTDTYGNKPVYIKNIPDATGGALVINSRAADNSYSDTFYISGYGNVGIGTTDPDEKLDVSDGNAQMLFGAASSDRSWLQFKHNAVPADGEELGLLDFRGYNDASEDTRYVILTAKAEDVTDGSEDGSLTFQTIADGTATQTLTMRSGNVGIGTDSPVPKMHLVYSGGTYSADSTSGFINQADTGRATMRLRSIQDAASELFFDVDGGIRWDISARPSAQSYNLNFYPAAATAAYNQVSSHTFQLSQNGDVIVTGSGSSGKMGIGTTSPDAHLEISANAGADPSPITNPVTLRLTDAGTAATGQGDTTNPWAKIEFYSEDQSSGGPAVQAQISTIYDDIYSAGSHISFSNTSTPTNGLSEKMRINSNGNIRFNSYGAGYLQTDANGNITAGSVTTSDTLDDVTDNGNSTTNSIVLGDSTTNGTMLVRGSYASGNIVVIGGMKSSGGAMIGYGVKPDTSTNHGFVSSSSYTLERSAYYQQGNRHRWYAGASQDVVIGNAVTMSETMRLDFDKLGLSTSSPASLIHLGKPTNGSNIITFGEASIGGPHGLDFYGDDATRTKKYSIYYRTGTENISMETSDGTKRFEINQSGAVTLNEAFTFPTADGSAGAALVTNGSGSLSWNAGYQQYTPVGWGVLNNQTYTSTGSNISSNSTQAQAGTTPVQRNSATEFEATKAGWYEISYSFIVKNNYTNRAMIGAYMTASSSGGGGVIPGSHSTQYVRYSTYGEYAQIQNTFYYYTSYSSTNFYLLAYLLSGSMNMTTQAVSQSMISFRYINNDIT